MNVLQLTLREKWAIRAIYTAIGLVVIAAMSMAFDHARLWAGRHATPGAEGWEGLAFGVGIEMPAAIGLLLLLVWPKIAPNKPKKVPLFLLTGALALSLTVQQMYAGPHASGSTRFVAGFPSVLAFIFVHVLFMLMGLIDDAKREIAEEGKRAAEKQTRQRLGLGDIAAPPTLTSPALSGRRGHDMSPDMTGSWEHDTAPDTRPDVERAATGHDAMTPARLEPDTLQVSSHDGSGGRFGRPWAGLPDTDPDDEAAERVAATPDVLTIDRPDPDGRQDTKHDIGEDDTTPDVSRTPDTEADTTPKWTTYPLGPKAAEMRRNGATLKAIGEAIGKTERTLSRWELPEPERTKPVNGHDLTGANH